MKKATQIFYLLTAVLCATLLIFTISCDNGSGDDVTGTETGTENSSDSDNSDPWTELTSLTGLDGTWEGSIIMTALDMMGSQDDEATDAMLKNINIDVTTTIVYPKEEIVDDATVTGVNIKEVRDMTKYVEGMAEAEKTTAEEYWQSLSAQGTGGAYTFSESTPYTMTMEMFYTEAKLEELINIGVVELQIYQDKTKIKMTEYSVTDNKDESYTQNKVTKETILLKQ